MATEYASLRVGTWLRDAGPYDPSMIAGNSWTHSHCVSSAITTAQATSGTATVDVVALDCPLRAGSLYVLEYNLIYSISGLAVGAQFGVELVGLTADSVGYSVLMAADGSNIRSAATTAEGGMIGSGSSFSGGGPWSATITGALRTPLAGVSIARLLMRGQGVGVTLTLQPNSTAWFQEM